jgi:hypothetical protein
MPSRTGPALPSPPLLRDFGDAQSLFVHSVTGCWIRFPVDEVVRLLLATAVGGQPLIPGHGFPVRLVAPGRRGFWWVKWVDRIELQSTPPWWQPAVPSRLTAASSRPIRKDAIDD